MHAQTSRAEGVALSLQPATGIDYKLATILKQGQGSVYL